MNFFYYIRHGFILMTRELVDLAIDAYDWPLVGSWLGRGFSNLSDFTSYIAGELYDAQNWVDGIMDWLGDIVSWSDIRSLIRSWLPDIDNLVDWWQDWPQWVEQEIDDWWDNTLDDVRAWVRYQIDNLEDIADEWNAFWNYTWPQWTSRLNTLQSAWDNFWGGIFPDLVDFNWLGSWWDDRLQDVLALIDTAFTLRESLWAGWLDWSDSVEEFFSDPVEYIWARFTDWFLGPEA